MRIPALFSLFVLAYSTPLESSAEQVSTGFADPDTNFTIQFPIPEWTDRTYTLPYIDVDQWRDKPMRHRFVHGGFKGTELRFTYYFPPKELYKARFFQGLPAISGREDVVFEPVTLGAIIPDIVPFAFETGGYVVESNQGSATMFSADPTTASAAAAQFSRSLAIQLYGGTRPYGYVFGGSGGGYKTLTCAESTNVWDGSVPFIIGSPASIPNVFSVQAHAMRLLEGKFAQITDALEPGGSGDMYAGLNQEQREALQEVTRMGFHPKAWFRIEKIAAGYTGVFSSLMDIIKMLDYSYFTDFWKKPGYLGYSGPESLLNAKVKHTTTIKRIMLTKEAIAAGLPVSLSGKFGGGQQEVPAAFELAEVPKGPNLMGTEITVTTGAGKGSVAMISAMRNGVAAIGFGVSGIGGLPKVKVGDTIELNNEIYLAAQTYHRHQDPGPDFPVWDQFKENGKSKYPQRWVQLSKLPITGTGKAQSGNFKGKMIVIESVWDEAAYPWQADWYRRTVSKNRGGKEDDQFRLWMVDKCLHTSPQEPNAQEARPVESTRMVSYTPVIQQALRDLTQWVEKGIPPPPTSNYNVTDGLVLLPPSAAERKGVQPVVELLVNGKLRADVKVGETVQFTGKIEIPPVRGKVIAASFDFDGSGAFATKGELKLNGNYSATVAASHSFSKPGTYFSTLQGIGQASENLNSPFGRVADLGRVRVVVT